MVEKDLVSKACIGFDDLLDYGKGKDLYAWHIKKLEVFDKPMALSEFEGQVWKWEKYQYSSIIDGKRHWKNRKTLGNSGYPIKRPPQSYQYVWVKGE